MSAFDDIFNFHDAPIIAPAPEPAKVGDAWRKDPKFLAIRGISHKEIYTPCGVMERFVPNWVGKQPPKTSPEKPPEIKVTGKDAPLGYGKYRDKSITWIIENDSRYSEWMYNNVDKYKKLVDKLGLN
jgi:hypothetical protein